MTDTLQEVRKILRDTLQLGTRAERLTMQSPLLGSVPEFDSMAVVSVVTALEKRFKITIHDDEISAGTFASVGSVVIFIEAKLNE